MNLNKKIAAVAAVGAAVVATTALAAPAYADTAGIMYRNVSNPALCLDANASNGNVGSGAQVTAWPCNGGTNQQWAYLNNGTFHNGSNTTLCLDADATNGNVGPGAQVTAWTCNGGTNQAWG